MAATGAVSSGRNSSRILTGKSPGTLPVFLPFLSTSYTTWSAMWWWEQGSWASLAWTWAGRDSMFRGVYSWLIELKNSQIWFEDSKAVRPSLTCCGRLNVEHGWSPGRAVSLLTCLIQDVFLEATRLVCFSRRLVAASFSLAFTSFFSILYFALLPCLRYSLLND